MINDYQYIVVGAGLFGAVVAERIARELKKKILIVDKRDHIGGNAYAYIEKETGIEIHKYGSHIFHTSNENVWQYINQFTEFNEYTHKVYTNYQNQIYSLPINLHTINHFFKKDYSPDEAKREIGKEINEAKYENPSNFEEKAISLIGKSLYEAFIKGYTKKQWSIDPKDLDPEIITRLPVRYNYNNNYFFDKYQGIPKDGYEKLFRNILNNDNIKLLLSTDFKDIKDQVNEYCKVIYSGPIDELCDYQIGPLPWKSLRFDIERKETADYQGTSVINYAEETIPYTRIHEFKHYHPEWKNSDETIICKEYPENYRIGENPYYPINNIENDKKYRNYLEIAKQRYPNYTFGGRLGCYKYWDMDKVILNAMSVKL